MSRFLALCFMAVLLSASPAHSQSPDDLFLRIYFLIQDGDTLGDQNRASEALPKYLEAQEALQRFQKGYPDWNQDVIKFRSTYVASRIADLQAKIAARTASAAPAAPSPTASVPGQEAEKPEAANALMEAQLSALRGELATLRGDNASIEAKLKEALAAQPAVSDPRELAKAEERIRELQKENELLNASLAEAKDPAKRADTNTLARAQKALEDANKEIERQRDALAAAAKFKDELEQKLRDSSGEAQFASALRTENELLKKRLAELETAAAQAGDTAQDLTKLRLEAATLRSEKEVLANEKRALEDRLRAVASRPLPQPAAIPAELSRSERKAREAEMKDLNNLLKKLERERDDLRKKLESTSKQLAARKPKGAALRVKELERELASLRDRLAPLEASKEPYSEAELALMSVPGMKIAASGQALAEPVPATTQLSASTMTLVNDARRHFARREFDSAAGKFTQALQADERNVPALGGLAISEMELNRLDEAEKTIRKAIAIAPDNATAYSTLGQIKFRQKQYDAAYDALSRAAALEPDNAEVQNLLGVTLSQKGLRGPAETALRKALQLQPTYGSAHHNLAIVYLSAQPPLVELARWHYQKALAAGHPRNADLEKLLDRAKPTR